MFSGFLCRLFCVSSVLCVIPSVAEGPRIFLDAEHRGPIDGVRDALTREILRCAQDDTKRNSVVPWLGCSKPASRKIRGPSATLGMTQSGDDSRTTSERKTVRSACGQIHAVLAEIRECQAFEGGLCGGHRGEYCGRGVRTIDAVECVA